MVGDRDHELAQLHRHSDALTAEFNAVKRDHEAGPHFRTSQPSSITT